MSRSVAGVPFDNPMNRECPAERAAVVKSMDEVDHIFEPLAERGWFEMVTVDEFGDQGADLFEHAQNRGPDAEIGGAPGGLGFVRTIDTEQRGAFSGDAHDVFFDLGNLSVNSELNDEAEDRLLTLYFGQITKSSWARLQLMKMMSEFREGMWAVVQQAISSLDTDFVSYANERLDSCERLASQPEFESWLVDAANPIA